MEATLEKNKEIVKRFNYEVIQGKNEQAFHEIVHAQFVNHSVPAGTANAGKDGVIQFLQLMWQVFPDLKVTINMQLAEGDLVMTYKTFQGTHKGTYMGIDPTNRSVSFSTIDIIRLQNEQAIEHWSIRDNSALWQQLTHK
ncbi:ester cyclase [Niastella sp. OAS944]|uniref:ester cyclase n=1 Tax=Niastella sp. OAS944 TaxID=2664089 RepID=UPI00346E5911|nr:putative ester cyclase [Chitinophagaceae bacterium OAS944]